MTSRIAGEVFQSGVSGLSKRGDGRRAQFMLFESSRIADEIGNMDALPLKTGAQSLQNSAGLMRFLVGYSAIGGSDVIE